MDPFFNGQSPAAPAFAPSSPAFAPSASSFSVPVPVFPTAHQLPQQPQQVGEVQQTATYMPPFQAQTSPAQNSNTPSHPPYNQMITEAITALKEKEGSSRQAIAKYIERFYQNLPSGHANLLTHQLKKMKDNGQLVMVKHSYMLPGSAPEVLADLSVSSVPKRSPGRPPKLKPVMNANAVQQQTQVQQAPPASDANAQGSYAVPESVFAAIGLVDGVVEPEPLPKRRPGRPPKRAASVSGGSSDQNVTDNSGVVHASQPVMTEVAASGSADPPAKRRPGRPPKNGSINVGGGPAAVPVTRPFRGRGRPKQNAAVYTGRPRGRPRRNVESPTPLNAVSSTDPEEVPAHAGDRAVPTVSKRGRPGRPPKRFINEPITKTRQVPGKPVGRPPKQNERATAAQAPTTTAHVSNLQQLLAYQELRTKLELFQSRIKHSVGILKPFIQENQTPSNANEALQELEELSTLDITAASSLHGMTLLPPNQV